MFVHGTHPKITAVKEVSTLLHILIVAMEGTNPGPLVSIGLLPCNLQTIQKHL